MATRVVARADRALVASAAVARVFGGSQMIQRGFARCAGCAALVAGVTWSVGLDARPTQHAVTSERPSDASRPFAVLSSFAEHARSKKLTTSISFGVLGLSATGAGLIADVGFEQDYGKAIWIAGLSSIAVGGVLYFLPTPLEGLEEQFAGAESHDVRALEQAWSKAADGARIGRIINGSISAALGAGVAATGIVFAAGAGDLDDSARAALSMSLVLGGGGILAGGLLAALTESDVELGYSAAFDEPKPRSARRAWSVVAGPTVGGAAVGLQGTF